MMKDRFKRGEEASLIGVAGNLVLTALKLFIGIVSGSTAVMADAIHTFSDVLVSIITFIGIRISKKPADEEHPYGHYDAEAIAGLFSSIALVLLGFELIKYAYIAFLNPAHEIKYTAIYAVILTFIIKEPMARYTLRVAKEIKSPALEADGQNHRSDIYSSIAVLAAIVGSFLGFTFLDPIVGIAIAIIILWIGIKIGMRNINILMGRVPSGKFVKLIESRAKSIKGVAYVHKVKVHSLGAFMNVELHVCVSEDISLADAHGIAHMVQKEIVASIPEVVSALVHVEPLDRHHREMHKEIHHGGE